MIEDDEMAFLFDEWPVDRSQIEDLPVEQWLAIRKDEALRINPDTALVSWKYGQVVDPDGHMGVRTSPQSLRGGSRSAAGIRLRRAHLFCAESRKRHLGVVL